MFLIIFVVYHLVLFISTMFYMRKIADYLKILTDEEVKNFAVITFGECFRYTRKKLYFKLSEKIFFRKVEESLLYFCQHLMK